VTTNAHALSQLLIAERRALIQAVRRIVGSEPAAEDVTQSLWLKIQRIDDHPPIRNRRGFLYRLAHNLAVDHVRADRVRGSVIAEGDLPLDVPAEIPTALAAMLGQEDLARVDRAIATLSPRCRQALYLRRIEKLPAQDVARRMGVSRQMVARYIAEAMDRLLECLDDQG
jgi:RNA polymerase sigma factor (sigma-70 family)